MTLTEKNAPEVYGLISSAGRGKRATGGANSQIQNCGGFP